MFPPNDSLKSRNGFMIFFELISLLIWVVPFLPVIMTCRPCANSPCKVKRKVLSFINNCGHKIFGHFFHSNISFFVWVRKIKEGVDLFSDKKIHYFSCMCRSSEVFSFLLSSVVYVFFYIEKYFRYFSTNTFVSQCLLNHLKNLLENQFLQ